MLIDTSVHPSASPRDGIRLDLTVVPAQADRSAERPFAYDVAIVGLGYVGLPTALAFVAAGGSVVGVDVSTARLEAIKAGRVDLLSSDHERLVTAMDSGRLQVTAAIDAIAQAATVIICVPTPVDHHLVPELKALAAACASVVAHAANDQVILLTSTSYVGTTRDLLVEPLERRGFRIGQDIFVAFSPERIDPGNSTVSQESVPRVVGGVSPACAARAATALSAYAEQIHIVSTPEAAELTKLYENAFRAVNIALVNELADVSRELNVEIMEVIEAASTKPYGFMAFLPGSGVGGHCIPCDPHYLLWQLKRQRGSAPLLEQAMASIARRPRQVVDRARDLLAEHGKSARGSRIVVVGVTYKPGVADVRESPGIEILERLAAAGANVGYVDALIPELELSDGTVLRSLPHEPLESAADLVVLNTRHPGFDHSWVVDQPLILDATYKFTAAPHRATL
ncbi:MAG: nucleotide sugar dehydrogenase [Mycobacteriales bacterium]